MVLHYIYDPLCGWCYAAAPLLDAVHARLAERPVQFHAGGLFSQQRIDPAMVEHINAHDARIHQLSGQPFGEPYRNGLLNDATARLDSPAAIAAMLAMESLDKRSVLPMLKAIQAAHYQHGLKVVREEVLAKLAQALGQKADAFLTAYRANLGKRTEQHISDTRRLMAKTGVRGFPGFVVEDETGELRVIEHGAYYGKPAAFLSAFEALTAGH